MSQNQFVSSEAYYSNTSSLPRISVSRIKVSHEVQRSGDSDSSDAPPIASFESPLGRAIRATRASDVQSPRTPPASVSQSPRATILAHLSGETAAMHEYKKKIKDFSIANKRLDREVSTLKIQLSQIQVLDKEAQHLRAMLKCREGDVKILRQELNDVCQQMDYMALVIERQEAAVFDLKQQIIALEDDRFSSSREIIELRQDLQSERHSAEAVIRSLQAVVEKQRPNNHFASQTDPSIDATAGHMRQQIADTQQSLRQAMITISEQIVEFNAKEEAEQKLQLEIQRLQKEASERSERYDGLLEQLAVAERKMEQQETELSSLTKSLHGVQYLLEQKTKQDLKDAKPTLNETVLTTRTAATEERVSTLTDENTHLRSELNRLGIAASPTATRFTELPEALKSPRPESSTYSPSPPPATTTPMVNQMEREPYDGVVDPRHMRSLHKQV